MTPFIPILVRSSSPQAAGGLVFLPGGPVLVRLVEPTRLVSREDRRQFEREVGAVPENFSAAVFALLRLAQATKLGARIDLRAFVRLQAGAEVHGEIDLMQRIVGRFREDAKKVLKKQMLAPLQRKAKKHFEQVEREITERLGSGGVQSAAIELSLQTNRLLSGARVVLWWPRKEKRLTLGLFCERVETALAAAVLATIDLPQGLGVCSRCGKHFLRSKRGQQYCSLRCGNAARKARERAKERRR